MRNFGLVRPNMTGSLLLDIDAADVVRGLVEKVRCIPAELPGILAVAETTKTGLSSHQDKALQIKVVAGARFDRDLKCRC